MQPASRKWRVHGWRALAAVTHSAPEAPRDNTRTRRLLGMQQVTIPRAKGLPVEEIYEA